MSFYSETPVTVKSKSPILLLQNLIVTETQAGAWKGLLGTIRFNIPYPWGFARLMETKANSGPKLWLCLGGAVFFLNFSCICIVYGEIRGRNEGDKGGKGRIYGRETERGLTRPFNPVKAFMLG